MFHCSHVRLSLPQTVGGVFLERLADYLLVKSVFGFSLAWDGGSGVYLKMSEEHHGAPCGLCGNFNHIAGDDLTTVRGKTGLTGSSASYPVCQHPLTSVLMTGLDPIAEIVGDGRGRRDNWGLEHKFFLM